MQVIAVEATNEVIKAQLQGSTKVSDRRAERGVEAEAGRTRTDNPDSALHSEICMVARHLLTTPRRSSIAPPRRSLIA